MNETNPAHLRRTVGLVGLVAFGLSYMAVGTVFTTYGIVNQITEGHLVLSYIVALIVMLFTASSYAAMVRKFPVAGSAYTYTQQAYGGTAGFLTGWVLMLDYLFIPMINFMILGLYVGTQFPSVPDWVFMMACLLLVLLFNVLGIKVVARLNVFIIAVSVSVVVLFGILALKSTINDPNAPGLLEPFIPGSAGWSPVFTGAAVLALSFLGFDAVSTLSEESKNPRKHIPLAIMLTTLFGGLLFIVISYLGARAYYLDDWSQASQELLDAAGVVLADHVAGPWFIGIFIFTVALRHPGGRGGHRLDLRSAVPGAHARSGSIHDQLRRAGRVRDGQPVGDQGLPLPEGEEQPSGAWPWIRYGAIPTIGFLLTIWLWTSLEPTTWIVGAIWVAVGLAILMANTRFFTKPVPVLDFSEDGATTEAIDALGEDFPLDGASAKE